MHKLESPILIVIEDTERNVSFTPLPHHLDQYESKLNKFIKPLFENITGVWSIDFMFTTCVRSFLWYRRIPAFQVQPII